MMLGAQTPSRSGKSPRGPERVAASPCQVAPISSPRAAQNAASDEPGPERNQGAQAGAKRGQR